MTTPPDPGFAGLPISRDGKPIAAAYAINGAINITCPHCQSQPGEACWNPITEKDRKIPCLKRINHAKHTT